MSEKLNKYLSENLIPWIDSQPEILKQATKNNIDKILNWELDFYSFRGNPIIYSYQFQNWYELSWEFIVNLWHTIQYENRIIPLSLEEFNKEFHNFWDYLKSKFMKLAQFNNLWIYKKSKNLFFEDISQLIDNIFQNLDNENLKSKLFQTLSLELNSDFIPEIDQNFQILFMVYKMLEFGVNKEDISLFLDNINNEKSQEKINYYSNYQLISDIFELLWCYEIYFSNHIKKFSTLNARNANVQTPWIKQEIYWIISLIEFKNKFIK